jgi:hypothetical protein
MALLAARMSLDRGLDNAILKNYTGVIVLKPGLFCRTVSRDADSQFTRESFLRVPDVKIYLDSVGSPFLIILTSLRTVKNTIYFRSIFWVSRRNRKLVYDEGR